MHRCSFNAIWLAIGMLVSVLLTSQSSIAHAQSPTATSDPSITALQTLAANQATESAVQATSVAQDIEQARIDFAKENLPYSSGLLTIMLLTGVVSGVLGGSIVVLAYAKRLVKSQFDQAIFRTNPTNVPVKVPEHDFDKEKDLLRRFGFNPPTTYAFLDEQCLTGCVVVIVKSDEDLAVFQAFLGKYRERLDNRRVAFLLYTPGYYIKDPIPITDIFSNLTFANTAPTLGTNLFTLARVMVARAGAVPGPSA